MLLQQVNLTVYGVNSVSDVIRKRDVAHCMSRAARYLTSIGLLRLLLQQNVCPNAHCKVLAADLGWEHYSRQQLPAWKLLEAHLLSALAEQLVQQLLPPWGPPWLPETPPARHMVSCTESQDILTPASLAGLTPLD